MKNDDDKSDDIPKRDLYEGADADANTFEFTKDGKTITVLGSDFQNPRVYIDEFVSEIIETKELAFEVTHGEKPAPTIRALPLGRYLGRLKGFMRADQQGVLHSEKVRAFFQATEQLGLKDEPWSGKPSTYNPFVKKYEAELLNELIQLIRTICQSKEFKSRSNARVYNATRNLKGCKVFLDKLFKKHSRLLVIRLDFGYRLEYCKEITIAEAQMHLKRLFNNVRHNKLFDSFLKPIWRREHGKEKGIHFHVVLFFDGHLSEKDEYIAAQIGEYWNTVVTKGKGVYFNCNRNKFNRYKRLGIGRIDYFDTEKRANLLEVVSYLTKKEIVTGMTEEGRFRAFGKGNMPSDKENGPGRPRMYGPLNEETDVDEPDLCPD